MNFGRLRVPVAVWAGLTILATVCIDAAHHAAAAPEVEIKAQSLLQLGEVRKISANRVRVTGTFLDRITGTGIGNANVTVSLGTASAPVTTGPAGEFSVELPAPDGELPVGLYFAGSTVIDPTSAETVTNPARSPTTLHINVAATTLGADLTFDVGPVAEPGTDVASAANVPLVLTFIRDGKERALGASNSGEVYPLTRAAIGGAGAVSMKATFAGDSLRQPAVAETGIDLRVGSTTTLAIDGATRNVARAFEDSLTAQGRILDDDGAPAIGAAVGLYAGDKRIDQTTADRNGGFRIEFEAKLVGTGQFGLTARTEKSAARDGSSSAPVVVAIAAPQPVPVRYTLMAFAATAVAALVFFALRRRRVAKPKVNNDDQPRAAVEITGGITVGKPGFAATLRRAGDTMFLGQVRDAWRLRPLGAAVLELALRDERREFITDATGRFEFEDLPPGPWQATIKAAGHIAEQVTVTIPHRGEMRGVTIDLVPVRERVFHLYRRAAEPLLPTPALWGVWSPRQIVDHVRSRRPSPALAALTNLVEEVYFSQRLADEAVLALTSSRVEAAIVERGHPG